MIKRLMDRRPLNIGEVEVRVGQKNKDKGVESLLLYKTARVDSKLLNLYYGEGNWQCNFEEIKGVLFCSIGVWDEDKEQWVWKADAGKESAMESEKGEASDAFKRAGFKWGIGVELYDAPRITLFDVPDKYHEYEVTGLGHSEDGSTITFLEITRVMGRQRDVVFTFGSRQKEVKTEPAEVEETKEPLPAEQKHHTADEVWTLIIDKFGRNRNLPPNDAHNVEVKRNAVNFLRNSLGISSLKDAGTAELDKAYDTIADMEMEGPENFVGDEV